jgi:uncharacterized protein (TIGR00288 family)
VEDNLCVLIDFENVAAGTEKENLGRFDIDAVIARLKDKGRILIARSYADWGRFARFKQSLLAANVTMMELTSHGMQDKNRADIAMVVDCLELAYTRNYIDTFVVVSGDSDFTPLVLKLRELNKKVIGIGTRRSTSSLLINASDEFIFYDTIVRSKEAPPRRRAAGATRIPKDRGAALALLTEALDGLQRENPEAPQAGIVKQAMTRRKPDFSEGDLGFGSFTKFLEFARDQGVVALTRDKKGGGFLVDGVDEDEAPQRTEGSSSGGDDADERGARGGDAPRGPSGEAYDDPLFPEGAMVYVDALHAARLAPMAHPTRMNVLEELVESADQRRKKRRRTTPTFVIEDIKKVTRKTYPDLSTRHIKELLGALVDAGALLHKDGASIRSLNAAFELDKSAEQLNKLYTDAALRTLRAAGISLDRTDRLAALLLGDAERKREIETAVAWLDAPASDEAAPAPRSSAGRGRSSSRDSEGDNHDDGDLELDLDALLVEEAPVKASKASKAPRAAPRAAQTDDDLDALLSADDGDGADSADSAEGEPEAAKPKRRRSRSRKTGDEGAAAAEASPSADAPEADAAADDGAKAEASPEAAPEADADAAPRPARRRRTKKADAEPAADASELDLDSALSVED